MLFAGNTYGTCKRHFKPLSPYRPACLPPQEIFSVEELTSKFSLDRITKSAAVFDKVLLGGYWGAAG